MSAASLEPVPCWICECVLDNVFVKTHGVQMKKKDDRTFFYVDRHDTWTAISHTSILLEHKCSHHSNS